MTKESRLLYRIAMVIGLIIFMNYIIPVFADNGDIGISMKITNNTGSNETVTENPTEIILSETTVQSTNEKIQEQFYVTPSINVTNSTLVQTIDIEPLINAENNNSVSTNLSENFDDQIKTATRAQSDLQTKQSLELKKQGLSYLKFDDTQKKVLIKGEFSFKADREKTNIPLGSVVYQSKGVTRVFDKNGKQGLPGSFG